MIKAIIFDIGDTLTNNDWRGRIKAVKNETGIALDLTPSIKIMRDKATLGEKSFKEVLALFSKTKSKSEVRMLVENYKTNFIKYSKIKKEMIGLLRKLRNNYKVYALSNTNDVHASLNKKRGIFENFDTVFLSHKIGLKKPDRRIFIHVLKNISFNADEIIFIDDLKDNINAAEVMGMKTILYKGHTDLLSHLKRFGVKI